MAKCIIICGQKGSGKTTLVVELIKESKNNYLFDINNEQKYNSIQNNCKGITDFEKFTLGLSKAKNCFIVFEEATIFFGYGRTQKEVLQLLVQARHRDLNIIFVFHSLTAVPNSLLPLCDYLFLKRTKDNPTSVERKYKDFPEVIENFNLLKNANLYDYEILEL